MTYWFPPRGVDRAIGNLRKALYVLEMNRWKDRTKPETKDRLLQNVITAAKELGECTQVMD